MTVNVLVELSNRNIDKYFTYNVPKEIQDNVKVGIRVKVPFGKQTLEGFVMEINKDIDQELKDIIEIVDKDIILNDELTYENLSQAIDSVIDSKEKLIEMGKNAEQIAPHDVEEKIYNEITDILKK